MGLFGSKKTKTEDNKDESLKNEKKAVKVDGKEKTEKVAKTDDQEATSMKDLYSETSGATGKGKAGRKYLLASHLLVKPLVTEKATNLSADNKYVFVVDKSANKIEVAKAIESVYGVKPVEVNIINMKGKRVSRGRIRGQRKDWKKAIVTLAKGDTITIYEGV